MAHLSFIMRISLCVKKLLIIIFISFACPYFLYAQANEHIVILWDVTGSLLSSKGQIDSYSGEKLPAVKTGNGMWVDLKTAVIDCIQFTDSDPGNKITVVTFNQNIRDIFTRRATEVGKKELVNIVENYSYVSHKWTNIVEPVKKFYSLLDNRMVNYMFLFTDGDNDDPSTISKFIPTLTSWESNTSSCDAYGFYVLVHPDAATSAIKSAVQSQDNFWIVSDSKVRIKICTLPSLLKYNIRDEKGPKTIYMSGKYDNAEGDVNFVSNDPYYEVFCTNQDIKDGRLDIEVKPKVGVTPPSNHTVCLSPVISNADQYTFVGPNVINLEVSNLPERNLDLIVENNKFGKASYYDSFLWVPENTTSVISKVNVNFSSQASVEGSSATMMVYFMDDKGENRISPSKLGLTLLINGEVTESVKLTPDISEIVIEVTGDAETSDGQYYGRIQMIPSNLDNCTINSEVSDLKWKFDFDQKCNPLKLTLTIVLIVLLSLIILWVIVFKPIFYPRFGSIIKTFNVPGMAPLIIKFKGARMVVVSATPQKKQSGWNRIWTGKILYKLHPTFTIPMTFVPGRGKKILVRTQSGTYQISPNPMPIIGSATIDNLKSNIRITIN